MEVLDLEHNGRCALDSACGGSHAYCKAWNIVEHKESAEISEVEMIIT